MKPIYLDNHLLLLEKPAGMLTQPDGTQRASLQELGKAYLAQRFAKKGAVFLEALHRLDRPTSGIVLFARTSKALRRLQESLRELKWEKTYLATVEGYLEEKKAYLEDYLLHASHHAKRVSEQTPGAKKAKLHYEVLSEEKGLSLLQVRLFTGRYHQIRAQLAAIGHPILGDFRYGAKAPFEEGIALCHAKLEFFHPVSKEKLSFNIKLDLIK